MARGKPTERAMGLLGEIERLYGHAIRKGMVGRVQIEKEYEFTESEARWVTEKLRESVPRKSMEASPIVRGNYDYNERTDLYTLDTPEGPLVVDGEDVRDIRRSYSNWTGTPETAREIATRYEHLTLRQIKRILYAMGIIHDSSPFTSEEIEVGLPEELEEELLRQKKAQLAKRFEKREHRAIAKKALAYDLLEMTSEIRRERQIEDLSVLAPVIEVPSLNLPVQFEDECVALLFPADIHFGKLAMLETTGVSYNLDIARNVLLEHTHRVLTRLAPYNIGELHIVVGSDWFHVDGYTKSTTKGTPQDVAGTAIPIFRRGKKLAVEMILLAAKFVPKITVSTALGNHDRVHSAELADFLDAWFRNDPSIEVDVNVRPRTYFRYGNTLVGITHGDGPKQADLGMIMAQEARELWGETTFREVFVGHVHHKARRVTEQSLDRVGVRVHTLPSLAATDEWHELQGFVQSVRSIEAHIIHPTDGLIGHAASNVLPDLRGQIKPFDVSSVLAPEDILL